MHGWAVLTAVAGLCVLSAGSFVTTLKVGMADPGWPSPPWYLFFLSPADYERGVGFLVEHAHRLAGWIVGFCVIVLAVGLWGVERRRWLCWLGTLALIGVSLQGVLGGMRVLENVVAGRELATIHGCFAQLVFALLVSIGLFTSAWWKESSPVLEAERGLAKLASWAAAATYLQVVFGAILRHTYSGFGQRMHLVTAFVVVVLIAWLCKRVLLDGEGHRRLRAAVGLVAVLVFLQVMLGIETWISRFSPGAPLPESQPPTAHQIRLMTLHFLTGTLLFATAVATALLAVRRAPRSLRAAPAPSGLPEGIR